MIDQSKNCRTIATAIAATFLLLSPGALLATDAEDAKAAATNMVTAADEAVASSTKEFNREEPVYKAAVKLQAAAADWKAKADQWANAPDEEDKRTAAETAKKSVDEAKGEYDKALANRGGEQDKATFQSDYNAKHFSLVLGAVVLNPFKLESVDTDADPMTTEFRVENGNTDANELLEAGFRRRWAWENWENASLRAKSSDLERTESQLRDENSMSSPSDSEITRLENKRDELRLKIANLRKQAGADELRVYAPGWEKGEGWSRILGWSRDSFLVPKNYTVRLGFALGSDDPSGAAAVAGAGEFYLETGLGWDWVRALYPTGGEPLRIAAGPELFASFSNDPELDDFHHRILVGGALTAGVPLGEGEERLAEIVVRMGW